MRSDEIRVTGITSFDSYAAWSDDYTYGIDTVCPNGIHADIDEVEQKHLSEEDKLIIQKNIQQNVISLAEEYPKTTFYYFITPYSAAHWAGRIEAGEILRQIEAEQYIIELILECDNIRLYSFSNRTDITMNLNHYKDSMHYGGWVNSWMLRCMYDGEYLLTEENHMDYLKEERTFYTTYDYESLNGQEDYECDEDAELLLE